VETTCGCARVALLADDEDMVRALARVYLERAGYVVLAARDGPSALRLAAGCPVPIDLLVADVSMPGMGGPELARRVRERHPAVKVLLTSGYTGDALAGDGIMELKAHLLEKPFTAAALVCAAREALAGDRAAGVAACVG
jgi:two-component system, cell cycle sensor histidine kinase and response regulator CckA